MKRNHFYLLLPVIHLITILHLNAQEGDTLNTSSYFKAPLIGRRYLPPPNGDGSPFLFNGIVNGDVIVTTGDTLKNKLLKFDGLRNELIWLNDQNEFVCLDNSSSNIKAFTLYSNQKDSPHHFTKMTIKLSFMPDSTYYLEVLNDTVFLTYAYRYIEVINEQNVIDGALRETNIYKPKTAYFIKLEGRPIIQIRLNRRSLIKAIPSYSKKMKKILNKSKIRAIKNEQQLKEAVLLLARYIDFDDLSDY